MRIWLATGSPAAKSLPASNWRKYSRSDMAGRLPVPGYGHVAAVAGTRADPRTGAAFPGAAAEPGKTDGRSTWPGRHGCDNPRT
ncbi:hypothetical protein GCM10009676_34000 [Prauserella halophila]|uniref:Uncharacterized protein n=1 Tax=Prauserella halophila TaxID=185641 RepID=A0ABN1WCF9_9PSEU